MKKTITLLLCALGLVAAALFAAETTTETVVVQTSTRISQVLIDATDVANPLISITRERVRFLGGEVLARAVVSTSARRFAQIAGESVTLQSGKTLTPAEFQEGLLLYAARWKTEDEAPSP